MQTIFSFLGAAAAVVAVSALGALPVGAQERPKVVAYVPNWIDLGEFTKTIAWENLTHINIAFENPVDDIGNLSFHAGNQILLKKVADRT